MFADQESIARSKLGAIHAITNIIATVNFTDKMEFENGLHFYVCAIMIIYINLQMQILYDTIYNKV